MKNALLALLGFILLSTPLAATAQQFGDFTYTSDGSAITITGYTGPGGAITIPATINGLPVTSIGGGAFRTNNSVTSVIIPSGVTSILNPSQRGGGAFSGCGSLASVTIPDSLTYIGSYAFYSCPSLIEINVDVANASYSSLDGVLFNKSHTTLLQFPGGKAGNYSIPDSVTSLGEAFTGCISLTSVTIPGSVANMASYEFAGCTSLTSVTILNGVASIGGWSFYNCISLTSIIIPGSVTNIPDHVFLGCASLTDITIQNGVTSIGDLAFDSCTSLTNITIPSSVTSIGDFAFEYCTSLKGVFFRGNTPSVGVPDLFYVATNAIVYYLPGTIGWGGTFAGRPAVLWNPLMQTSGVGSSGFGFNITGTADIPIVIEAAASLANAAWVPLQSLNLTNGAFYFSDRAWTNSPARFYRLRSP